MQQSPAGWSAVSEEAEPEMVTGKVERAISRLLRGLELDDAGLAKAEIARTLARKLDQSSEMTGGAMAMAVAGIAKELRELVDAILESTEDNEAFVADLFAPVGNTQN